MFPLLWKTPFVSARGGFANPAKKDRRQDRNVLPIVIAHIR